jgi:hypothetical protein
VLLVIVMVAEPLPLPEQPPVVVMAMPRPEDAVAATGNVLLKAALGGAAVVTVMLWLASPAVVLLVTSDAAL